MHGLRNVDKIQHVGYVVENELIGFIIQTVSMTDYRFYGLIMFYRNALTNLHS